jgi:hypothetical protein
MSVIGLANEDGAGLRWRNRRRERRRGRRVGWADAERKRLGGKWAHDAKERGRRVGHAREMGDGLRKV